MRHDGKAEVTETDKILIESFIQPGDINSGDQAKGQEHVDTMPIETKISRRMEKVKSKFRNKFK